ncbi:MAG: multiple sugar transport system permease protein [Thermoanaerobacterium sp.]|nr:multiple sugar transport system permease protein [Thermoanaerobacterium sp.]MDK2829613.1 multiple sugar transport system permease protein [Clostridium butyricum]
MISMKSKKLTKYDIKNIKRGLFFISPWLIGFMVFTIYPFIASLIYSFSVYNGVTASKFIGLKNYIQLFQDPKFYTALYNTFYYAIIAVPLGIVLGVLVALLLNQPIKFLSFFRTAIYIPVIVPTVAVSILWIWLLNPDVGLINWFLSLFGIKGPGWLADPKWSKMALILMAQWGIGQSVLIYLSGLKDVPKDLYESADIDGANGFSKFFHITLPMITPVILYNLIMGVIGSLQYFTQAYVMTNGGPMNSTLFYALYLFQNAFQFFSFGYASAMAWILFIIIAIIVYILLKTSARWVFYGGQ